MISNMSTLSSLHTASTSHHSLASSQSTHTLTSQSGITSHQSHSHHNRTGTSQNSTRGIFDSTIYEAFLPGLKSEKRPTQLKTAKELYATLLNELKHLRRDQESIYIDSYISHIKRFSQDHAKLSERQACIFYVTSLISVDSLNMRLSKLHQTSLMLLLRSLMSFNDRHLVQMSAKAMGKFVQSGGVECDSEFKTALENLRNESRRYNGIVTLRELAQASPSRLYLNSPMFFEDIVIAMCDKSIQIRTEACELFRLSLKISISRESSTSSHSSDLHSGSHNTTRRTSITSQSSLTSNSHESLQSSTNTSSTKHQSQEQPFNDLFFVNQYRCCFENSVRELDKEITTLQSASNKPIQRDDKIHGYLLIILEILKFSERNLAFEKDIEKYLSTYYYRSQGDTRVKTREELHSRNLSNMLPHTIEASHTANPFTFLFNWESEKITVDMESKNCSQLIADRYDVILSCIERLYNASRNGSIFIQHTLLQMLPRLANFNRNKFAHNHLAKCMNYLQSLLSRKSGSSMPTELLYAIGFLSLALGDDLQPYCEPFIELIRSCSLLQPQNNQSNASNRIKKASSTSSNPPQSQSALLSQVTSTSSMLNSAANALLSQRLTSILPNSSTQSSTLSSTTTTTNTILSSPSSSTPTLSSPSPNQPLYNPLQRISTETSDEFNAIVACIAMLSRAMPHEMHELLLKLLEPLMLISGGVNATIRACLDEICQSVPQLKASIHENLLKMLSQILTNRPLCHLIQSVASSASHLMTPPSLSSLSDTLSPADMPTTELTNTELTINALQTLRCFDFNPIYVIVFLRYSIDVYLQNDTHKELRIESVLTASHLLTRLIEGALKAHESRSLISLISSSLHKLLTSAISDYEPDTRYYVLHSLTGTSFQMFLSLPDHLNILFLCTRDLSFEIRELAAWMLSRLTHANSAHTQPFIRKFLMDLLQETQLVSEVSLKEQSVRLMGHLLSHTPRLVNLYMKPLTECLHSNLRLHRDDLRFTTSSLTVIGQLAAQSSPDSLEHFEAIIPLLIELLQDAFYVQRRHTSLWALGQIIANTGYVIEPYKRYPSLLPTLLDLLMKESNTSMRRETMRILGLLGALDPFEYKQHLTQSQYDENTPQAIDSDSQKTKSKEPNEMLAGVNMNTTGLDDYYPALAIHLIMKFIKNAVGNAQRKDGLQALILAMRSLDNRCVNYVDMVIPALLELIETVSLNDTFVIELIGQLSNLVLYIRRSVEPYVNSILDVVTHYWHASERHAMIIALIELVQSVLNVLEIDFKKYMSRLVPLVVSQMRRELHEYSQTNPFASIHRLAVLIRSATPCIEPYVSLIIPACCEYIRSSIISDTLKQEILFTVYHLSRHITLIEHCSMLFHAFTVALERHLESSSNISIETPSPSSNSLLTTSISLQQLTTSPQSNLPSTLRPQGVTQSSDISLLILETLYQIGVKQMGSKFTPYIAMFDRCIRKSTSINPTSTKALLSHLRQMSRYLTEAAFASRRHSFISDNTNEPHSNDSPDSTTASTRQRRTNNSTTTHNLSTSLHEISEQISPGGGGGGGGSSREASEKPLARMAAFQRETRVDFNNIRACLDRCEHIASHEGWRESFRRFMITMVEETPASTLRVCSIVHDQVQADLFNACFISIWLKISEKEQNELIKYLELALRLSDVPEIIKTILNLAEFMERCDTLIPIDYKILAEKAFQVRAYAKALHYVEELFSASTPTPTSDTLELLIILNHELGKDEAASGVLEYANKHLKTCFDTRIRERWYEKLHQWQKALSSYEKELNSMEVKMAQNPNTTALSIDLQSLSNAKLDLLLGKMRCLRGMAMWNELRDACRDLFEHLSSITPTESSLNDADTSLSRLVTTPFTILISPAHQAASMGSSTRLQRRQTSLSILSSVTMTSTSLDQQQLHLSAHEHALYKTRVAEMGAVACWGLAAWDDMAKYAQHVPEKSYDGSLYRSVLAINRDEYPDSLRHIAKSRDLLDSDLTSMASQSYERAYQAIISTQVLAELEEVIKFKEEPEKRETLREAWWKRLDSCEKTTENWHRLLLVRSLVLAKERDVRPWLKFATMCQKEGNLKLTGQILRSLLSECGGVDSRPNPSQYELEECKYAALKYEWVLNANNSNNEPKLAIIGRLSRLIASNEALDMQLAQIGVNPREVQRKREQISALLAKCYLKKGEWIETESPNGRHMAEIIECFARAKTYDPTWYKAWNAWSYANYDALLKSTHDLTPLYTKSAVTGFFRCINLAFASSHLHENNCLQDTLKLLTIWFNYAHSDEIAQCVLEGINNTPMDIWLQVIPQLIARIDTPKAHVGRLIQKVLIDCGRVHPQALVYRLILASKCPPVNMHQTAAASMVPLTHQTARNLAAQKVLDSLREHYNVLVEHAKMVSEELIRVAILWHELWHESIEEASRLCFGEKNIPAMLETLDRLHAMMERGATTGNEIAFIQLYGREFSEAKEFCDRYRASMREADLEKAWQIYFQIFKKITKQLPNMLSLELNFVSPKLMASRALELAVPGTYEPSKPLVTIASFHPSIQVISSKQRPRKIAIFGSNGRKYVFLLKGHEDMRQDERVMQIFGLVNNLLVKNQETARRDLAIQRYSVIPLSQNSGLLEWLLNCDTLHSLIKEYRDRKRIALNLEHRIIQKAAPDYEHLTAIQKVEIFESAINNEFGDDLAKILWHKSATAEKWLERRTNYTRSLAVMSMVGYVLGLGDRHPSNLMLDRTNGKIIHVDFGDCFETAMTREKFPEKIPFRLTRMLKNAMEVTGIEGTFRLTCEAVMRVLRTNRESVMAVLEAFVYDPLVYWKLFENNQQQQANRQNNVNNNNLQMMVNGQEDLDRHANNSVSTINSENGSYQLSGGGGDVAAVIGAAATVTLMGTDDNGEEQNHKALSVLKRVKDKLTGFDFGDKVVNEKEQVEFLIRQATSAENLCQCFIGWCAWW